MARNKERSATTRRIIKWTNERTRTKNRTRPFTGLCRNKTTTASSLLLSPLGNFPEFDSSRGWNKVPPLSVLTTPRGFYLFLGYVLYYVFFCTPSTPSLPLFVVVVVVVVVAAAVEGSKREREKTTQRRPRERSLSSSFLIYSVAPTLN